MTESSNFDNHSKTSIEIPFLKLLPQTFKSLQRLVYFFIQSTGHKPIFGAFIWLFSLQLKTFFKHWLLNKFNILQVGRDNYPTLLSYSETKKPEHFIDEARTMKNSKIIACV